MAMPLPAPLSDVPRASSQEEEARRRPSEESRHFKDARRREVFLADQLARVPRWYSPLAHVLGTTGVGVLALALAVSQLRSLRAVELLTLPAVFVVSNLFEWYAHRHLLHRRAAPFTVLYDRHTPSHHRIYREESMEVSSWRELRFVLIPATGVFGITLVAAPFAAAVGWLLGANVGWLFLLGEALYVVTYELTHLTYHLPKSHPLQRLRLVRWLSAHHARHHDPKLMQRYNFNVTLPLGDWLFGTTAPKR